MKLTKQARKFFQNEGKKGGEKVLAKYGKEHYRNLIKKRWDKRKNDLEKLSPQTALTNTTP